MPATSDFPNLTENDNNTPTKHSEHQYSKYGEDCESNDRINADLDQIHNAKQWKCHTRGLTR